MPYELPTLKLSGITQLCGALRRAGEGARSMEEAAGRIASRLREDLVDGAGKPACALVRVYRTMRYGDLDPDLRAFGADLMRNATLTDDTRCLTLFATAGDRPEWNSRLLSRGHRTIPLPGEDVVARIPMVAQLVAQLGIDVATVVRPDAALLLEAEQHTYNVFYVPEALGSPFIPAQAEFVAPCGIRSVIGFGGVLPGGDMFAVLLFAKVFVPRSVADMFRNAAMNVKLALLPFVAGPAFSRA
jgi:two-component system NtrC family sensor kinase